MRKRLRVACVLLLLAAAQAHAAPPVEVPTTVRGEPGAFVTVRAKTEGKVVVFLALDDGLNVFPAGLLADRRATVVTASKAGTYRLLAYSSVGDEPTDPVVVAVVIGTPAPVPPQPIPPDPAPVPDPLLAPVQAAYTADASVTKAADGVALAAVYRACAESVKDVRTAGELFAVIQGASRARIGDRLATVRPLFGAELAKVLPAEPGAALTAQQRADAVKQLNRFAAVLEGVR